MPGLSGKVRLWARAVVCGLIEQRKTRRVGDERITFRNANKGRVFQGPKMTRKTLKNSNIFLSRPEIKSSFWLRVTYGPSPGNNDRFWTGESESTLVWAAHIWHNRSGVWCGIRYSEIKVDSENPCCSRIICVITDISTMTLSSKGYGLTVKPNASCQRDQAGSKSPL